MLCVSNNFLAYIFTHTFAKIILLVTKSGSGMKDMKTLGKDWLSVGSAPLLSMGHRQYLGNEKVIRAIQEDELQSNYLSFQLVNGN